MSPLLFVVIMEALSKMMSTTGDIGLLFGFLVGSMNHEEMVMPHLLITDDMLIFC